MYHPGLLFPNLFFYKALFHDNEVESDFSGRDFPRHLENKERGSGQCAKYIFVCRYARFPSHPS